MSHCEKCDGLFNIKKISEKKMVFNCRFCHALLMWLTDFSKKKKYCHGWLRCSVVL